MNRFFWLAVVVVVVVGCSPKPVEKAVTPEEAAERAGLRREQYSGEAKGEQKIQSADGTTTELLKVDDLGQYGVKLYPGATAKEGDAFQKTDSRSVVVFYSLTTSDPAANVVKFYEKELKAKASSSATMGTIISGDLLDGKTAVVTVIDEGDSGSRAEVQVYSGRGQ